MEGDRKQFDSPSKYFLSTCEVPGPVLDPGRADDRVPALVELTCLQEIKPVSKQAGTHEDFSTWSGPQRRLNREVGQRVTWDRQGGQSR